MSYKHERPSPEEMALIQKERTLNDADFIKGGAEYVLDGEEKTPRLELTKDQIDAVAMEMADDFKKAEEEKLIKDELEKRLPILDRKINREEWKKMLARNKLLRADPDFVEYHSECDDHIRKCEEFIAKCNEEIVEMEKKYPINYEIIKDNPIYNKATLRYSLKTTEREIKEFEFDLLKTSGEEAENIKNKIQRGKDEIKYYEEEAERREGLETARERLKNIK